ncbi:RNA recognition motif domain [Trypanosoma melophagium]|uniref:RNA recognition motif domain n=1 Tax=Trypanosoma melophagium TaxID=715481 RepID=UPI00351A870F|nr:RNA recognition motif domain [Trypanosoma melophagium]
MSGRICIRSLSSDYDEQSLLRICASFGDINAFDTRGSAGTIDSECTAEVQYEEAEDAVAAAGNMNGMEFGGRYLRVFLKRLAA